MFKQNESTVKRTTRTTLKLDFEPTRNFITEYRSLLNSIYGLCSLNNDNNVLFTFGVRSSNDNIDFYVIVPNDYVEFIKKKFYSINQNINFEIIDDPITNFSNVIESNKVHNIVGYRMEEKSDTSAKIKLKTECCEQLFLQNIINSMNNQDVESQSIFEVSLIPAINEYENKNKFNVDMLVKGISTLLDVTVMNGKLNKYYSIDNDLKNENDISDKDILFNTAITILSKSPNKKNANDNIDNIITAFMDLKVYNEITPIKVGKNFDIRNMEDCPKFTPDQIVKFLHLPDKSIYLNKDSLSNYQKIYDKNIPNKGIIYGISNNNNVCFPMVQLSTSNYQQKYEKYEDIIDNISKPKLILGQMGTGKSEFIINYIINLAKFGVGLIIIDPKNDTQQRLIESMPHELMDRVIYINFGDTQYPPGMNIFKKRNKNDPIENSLIVTSFISLMKKEFNRNWGFRIQRTLQMTAEAILLDDCPTLNEFELMLTEPIYREAMIAKMKSMLKDKDNNNGKSHIKKLLKYWQRFNESEQIDIDREIEPVMNKIGVFLSNRIIRSIVCQKDGVDFRKAADEGKIIIINIPEGTLGDNTKLLSSMINKSIWLDIQSRSNVDISLRYPVSWIIDEAHEIVDDEFISVLTKSRAYRLGLILVTQGLSNFEIRGKGDIRELIATNCKNKIAFRLGYSDSRTMSEEYSPLTAVDLGNCPDYYFYGKVLLEDGRVSNPFLAKAILPAVKLRNYDQYISAHRSGKMTINDIENNIDDRLESIKLLMNLSRRYR